MLRFALPAAILTGSLIAIQTAIVGAFGERLNPFVASVWVHIGGLAFGLVGVLVARLNLETDVVRQAPWGLLAGVAGFIIISSMSIAVAGLGLASTLAIITGVQLLVGFVLETTGVIGKTAQLDPVRVGGALLIVFGVYLVASRGPGT